MRFGGYLFLDEIIKKEKSNPKRRVSFSKFTDIDLNSDTDQNLLGKPAYINSKLSGIKKKEEAQKILKDLHDFFNFFRRFTLGKCKMQLKKDIEALSKI
jgi:hypothetical protein